MYTKINIYTYNINTQYLLYSLLCLDFKPPHPLFLANWRGQAWCHLRIHFKSYVHKRTYIYICMYTYIHIHPGTLKITHTHTHTHTNTYAHTHTHTHICTHIKRSTRLVCQALVICIFVYFLIMSCAHTHRHTQTHTHTHTYTHRHRHIHTHTHTHTNTNTHTLTLTHEDMQGRHPPGSLFSLVNTICAVKWHALQ